MAEERVRQHVQARHGVLGRIPLPEGTLPVGTGLLVLGATAYVFLITSARVLGPERYSALAALWALVSLAGPGFFFPLEQEVGRALSARRVHGLGGGPVVRRAAIAGGGVALALTLVSAVLGRSLIDGVFDGQSLLLLGFTFSLFGYATAHLARGVLSGTGRFVAYGLLLGADGVVRLAGALFLVAAGVRTAGPFGLVIGFTPFFAVAVAVALTRPRQLVAPGPEASWSEVSRALGFLLIGSALSQLLINVGPLAVKLLAHDADRELAGRFLAAVILTRVPLFLFQALQAALLPKLAGLAAAGRIADFGNGLRRLVKLVTATGILSTLGAVTIGPDVLRLVFGEAYSLGRSHLAYLAGASAAFMLAQTLAQGVIALSSHRRAAVAWAVGVLTFSVVTALGRDPLLRVELGLVGGCGSAALTMVWLLLGKLRDDHSSLARDSSPAARPNVEVIEP